MFVHAEGEAKNYATQDPPVRRIEPCLTAASNASPSTIFADGLKVAFQLRKFTYIELKCATRNFRPECLLGEGGFGRVYKGWIEESGTGTRLTVAVKTLNHDGHQGHKEWVVNP
jgi:hypothetical protein